jgi:hypothetical protein
VVVGANCPAIEFDFGDQARIPAFFAKVQGPSSLGQCFLICSQLPATSTADVVQSGDLWAGGMYTVAQMNSNQALFTRAQFADIRGRFWRFVFFKQPPAA